MPDFEAQITLGADLQTWSDSVTPSRINPKDPLLPQLYHRVLDIADPVRFSVYTDPTTEKLAGYEPWDYELKGRPIYWAWVEDFGGPPMAIPATPGRSTVVEFTGQAFRGRPGHYLLMAYRTDGGAVAIPFIVEDARQTDRDANEHVVVTDSVSRQLL